jgi:ubiquinol-cytochrome c reductase core subunit 2
VYRVFSILTLSFQVAKSFLTGKATLVSVGDVFQLPYAEDIGLTV